MYILSGSDVTCVIYRKGPGTLFMKLKRVYAIADTWSCWNTIYGGRGTDSEYKQLRYLYLFRTIRIWNKNNMHRASSHEIQNLTKTILVSREESPRCVKKASSDHELQLIPTCFIYVLCIAVSHHQHSHDVKSHMIQSSVPNLGLN